MANEINRGGLNRVLQRTLTVKGEEPPAGVVGAEIVPTLPLEVDRPEWKYLAGVRRFQFEHSQSNVAGQFCKAAIYNPHKSGQLVVIDRITLYTGAPVGTVLSAIMYYGDPSNTGFNTFMGSSPISGPCTVTDFRWAERTNPGGLYVIANVSTQQAMKTEAADFANGIFLGDICAPINVVAAITPDRIPEWILPPGWFLGIRGAQNMALCVQWCGYERAIEPNELAVASAAQ